MSYSKFFKITTARFANVAFSNGSLLDGFFNRIKNNQPISCPTDIKRFFTQRKAVKFVYLPQYWVNPVIFFPNLDNDNLIDFKNITLDFFKFNSIKIEVCN